MRKASPHRRERIESAVVAGGKHARGPYEGWIAMDPRAGAGAHDRADGFERSVGFGPDEDAAVISEMVRATLEE